MQSKVHTLFSITMLVFFLPAILGFTLIDHHCTGCHSHQKETTFLFAVHHHDDASCFCSQTKDEATHDHSSSNHTHDCVVQLKKLEAAITPAAFDNWLPTPMEMSFSALFMVNNQILPESFLAKAVPPLFSPPRLLSGYERLIRNEVFRL